MTTTGCIEHEWVVDTMQQCAHSFEFSAAESSAALEKQRLWLCVISGCPAYPPKNISSMESLLHTHRGDEPTTPATLIPWLSTAVMPNGSHEAMPLILAMFVRWSSITRSFGASARISSTLFSCTGAVWLTSIVRTVRSAWLKDARTTYFPAAIGCAVSIIEAARLTGNSEHRKPLGTHMPPAQDSKPATR
jgi:hypothetical protein